MNVVDALAGGDVTKYEDVWAQPNATVFLKRLMMRQHSKFTRDHQKILAPKSST
jgi:hypothetical protein